MLESARLSVFPRVSKKATALLQAVHMDRRPRQNHRRCQTRAPNVRFDPLGPPYLPSPFVPSPLATVCRLPIRRTLRSPRRARPLARWMIERNGNATAGVAIGPSSHSRLPPIAGLVRRARCKARGQPQRLRNRSWKAVAGYSRSQCRAEEAIGVCRPWVAGLSISAIRKPRRWPGQDGVLNICHPSKAGRFLRCRANCAAPEEQCP